MPRQAVALLVLCLSLFSAAPALAQTWLVDSDHAQVLFTVRHVVGEVSGYFNEFTGQVEFDPDDPGNGRLDVQVIVSSLDTGAAQRDLHLLGPEFFDAGQYPTMRFVSEEIEDKGGGAYEARGHLTVKDVSRSESLPFQIIGTSRGVPGHGGSCTQIMGVRGRLTINRLDYNVGDGRYFDMGVAGDEVALTVRVELLRRIPDCVE